METMNLDFIIAILAGSIRAGTPLVFAGLGELIYEKSGVINLGIEGIMLVGAMFAVWAQVLFGIWVLSLLIAVIVCALFGLLHAFLSVKIRTNQIATGLAFVILCHGLTAFWGKELVGKSIVVDLNLNIPILSNLPIIGRVFFQQDILVFLAVIMVIFSWFFLFRTRPGIILRATGESAKVVESSGISIIKVRLLSGTYCGALCGLSGAYLSLIYASQWQENMVAGRGWIAIAMVIFSMWRPFPLLFGAYLFGGLTALNLNLQAVGIHTSPYFLGMLPFIITIVVLVVFTMLLKKRPVGSPGELGKPFFPSK
jgi:ABC-type uncharacterized transport system permease subunit